MHLVLFNPQIGPYQVLPILDRVNLGVIAMKGCSAFPQKPRHHWNLTIKLFSVKSRTLCEPLKLVDQYSYLDRKISSTKIDTNIHQGKVGTAIERLSIICKHGLSDKMERDFNQAVAVSVLLYRCTTCTMTKRMEKKLEKNYRVLFWIYPGSNTPLNSSYTITGFPSQKSSK